MICLIAHRWPLCVTALLGALCASAVVDAGEPRTLVQLTSIVAADDQDDAMRLSQAPALSQPTPAEPATPAAAIPAEPAPAPQSAATPARPPVRRNESPLLSQRLTRTRITRSPEMFGDQFVTQQGQLLGVMIDSLLNTEFGVITAPVGVHAFSQKVSENNHPLPRDRVFYTMNAFDDALSFRTVDDAFNFPASNSQTLFRHTLGVEKTFFDGNSSIEVRLPMYGNNDFSRELGVNSFAYDGGVLGNVFITGKTLIYDDDEWVVSTGLGVMTPTGEDTRLRVADTRLRIDNSAFYLSPFVGTLWTPNDEWFVMAFGQVQVSTNGDSVYIRDTPQGINQKIATVDAPAALSLDLSLGRWLFRGRRDSLITGMALISEVHQFATLQPTDSYDFQLASILLESQAAKQRLNLTTLTFGIHNELTGNSTLRVAGVVPVSSSNFDAELIVQYNFFY